MYAFVFALALHTIAATVWVGGMFFAHMALRPAIADLAPALRLDIIRRVLGRFFDLVWLAIVTLLATGYGVLLLGYRGGISGGGPHIDVMQIIGLTMMALFAYMFFAPWQSFQRELAEGQIEAAARHQARIRRIVGINLILGLITAAVGATGTLWAY